MSIRHVFEPLGQSDDVDKDVSDGNGDNNDDDDDNDEGGDDEDDEKIIADIRVWTSWLERTIQTAEGINGQQVVFKQFNFQSMQEFWINIGIFN